LLLVFNELNHYLVSPSNTGHTATPNDYIGEFFLFWFFPIGIWFIQPRINNIVSKDFIK
jgi:hypothetical protein